MTGEKVREMSNLVIVRHGEYGRDMRLNAKGRDQMYNMAEILQGVLARKTLCQIAVRSMGYPGAEVARFLGISTSAVNRLVSQDELTETGRYLE